MMKLSTEGTVQFLHQFGDLANNDACKSVAFDQDNRAVVFLLETTSPSLRPDYARYSRFSKTNTDILLITMRESGAFVSGFNINMDTASVSLNLGTHAFFVQDNYYVFGGHSYGYKTKFQNKTYDVIAPTLDTFVFKFDPTASSTTDCFYSSSLSGSQLNSLKTSFTASQISVLDQDNSRYLFKKMNDLLLGYVSRYSGGFDLGDTIKYPKMCADKSENMTDGVTYYRGQWELPYVIGEQSKSGSVVNQMDGEQYWMFQNGTDANGLLGRWDRYGDDQGVINIQTDA